MTGSTLTPPHTYAEWIPVLDVLKNKTDDANVLDAMSKGTLEWQSGVAERFAKRLIDVINYRMNGATDKFQKELARTRMEERAVVQALLSLRKELSFLSKAISIPVLPEESRQHYQQLVIDCANNIQSSLEDSAKKERSGKLASIVRNNRVNAF